MGDQHEERPQCEESHRDHDATYDQHHVVGVQLGGRAVETNSLWRHEGVPPINCRDEASSPGDQESDSQPDPYLVAGERRELSGDRSSCGLGGGFPWARWTFDCAGPTGNGFGRAGRRGGHSWGGCRSDRRTVRGRARGPGMTHNKRYPSLRQRISWVGAHCSNTICTIPLCKSHMSRI
jgi:hypothetical protein